MIKGTGVDMVEIPRIAKIISEKSSFARRVLTVAEFERFETFKGRRQAEFLAGRFASKEAFSKAVGTGIGRLSFQDLEVSNDEWGAPYFSKMPCEGLVHLTITHTDSTACAFVVLEQE